MGFKDDLEREYPKFGEEIEPTKFRDKIEYKRFKNKIKKGLIILGITSGITLGGFLIYAPIHTYSLRQPKEIQIENKKDLLNEEIKEAEEDIIIYEKNPSYFLDEEVQKNLIEANERGVNIKYFVDNFNDLNLETKKELTDLVENRITQLFKGQKALKYGSVFMGDGEKMFSNYNIIIRDGKEIHYLGHNNLRVPLGQVRARVITKALMERIEPISLN